MDSMANFKDDKDGLTKLFAEIKTKNTIQELAPEYRKFAEWLRIEYVSTLFRTYHLLAREHERQAY